jgi:hypothetical protein
VNSSGVKSFIRRAMFAAASLGSIALLLGHVNAVARMHDLAWTVGIPCLIVMAVVWIWAGLESDQVFLDALRAGFWGGLWGTIGYDLVRIPFHFAGQNPFTPIRVYGVWIMGAEHSNGLTDLMGVAYHFSNGLTFGWIYALVFLRRSWIWGIVWGLGLEALAVASAFGDVFAIRYAPQMLLLAFAAHVFYGAPLGWACQKPKRARFDWVSGRAFASVLLSTACLAWFWGEWQIGRRLSDGRHEDLIATTEGLMPAITDKPWREAQKGIPFYNRTTQNITVILRHSRAPEVAAEEMRVAPGERVLLQFPSIGLFQVLAPGLPGRSVLVAVYDGGNYRPHQ